MGTSFYPCIFTFRAKARPVSLARQISGGGVFASAKTSYSVAKLKDLTVELLPNNGSATTQDGRELPDYIRKTDNGQHR